MTDDPAKMMNDNARALAEERKLNVMLDQILAFEKQRHAASEGIRLIWLKAAREGIDVNEARRKLVYRAVTA